MRNPWSNTDQGLLKQEARTGGSDRELGEPRCLWQLRCHEYKDELDGEGRLYKCVGRLSSES
jgi:hypothetical protein